MRHLIVALAALVLVPAGLWAEEIRAQIKSVDAQIKSVDTRENTVTVLIGERERTLQCAPNCRVSVLVATNRRSLRRSTLMESILTLRQLTEGTLVTLTTETRGGSELVTQILSQDSPAGYSYGYGRRGRR